MNHKEIDLCVYNHWSFKIQCIFLLISVEKVFQIKEDTESMKKKIVSLKAELRKEMKIHDDKGEVCFLEGVGGSTCQVMHTFC